MIYESDSVSVALEEQKVRLLETKELSHPPRVSSTRVGFCFRCGGGEIFFSWLFSMGTTGLRGSWGFRLLSCFFAGQKTLDLPTTGGFLVVFMYLKAF